MMSTKNNKTNKNNKNNNNNKMMDSSSNWKYREKNQSRMSFNKTNMTNISYSNNFFVPLLVSDNNQHSNNVFNNLVKNI